MLISDFNASSLTWQRASKQRFAYAGSLKSKGHSGSPSTFFRASFQKFVAERLIRSFRKGLLVRARLCKSIGCKYASTYVSLCQGSLQTRPTRLNFFAWNLPQRQHREAFVGVVLDPLFCAGASRIIRHYGSILRTKNERGRRR